MLAVSSVAAPLTDRDVHHGSCQVGGGKVEGIDYDEAAAEDQFIPDFSDGNSSLLLESIDFDDLFALGGIHDGDVLPDLEIDPSEILAEFSAVDDSSADDFVVVIEDGEQYSSSNKKCKRPREEEVSRSGSGLEGCSKGGEDTGGSASPSSSSVVLNPPVPASKHPREGDKAGRKSTSSASTHGVSNKNNHGKRKVKVDWTPELHRRFVQAVEQLGVDKAVPSRILELMGIDCLTRHNVASHLQKYRSHRKHLLAREAEAATWTQRRQVYGGKRDHQKQAWHHPPMMGFPPPVTPPPPPPPPMHHHPHHLIRPLHVWGHPSMDQSLIHIWPKHLPHHHSSWTPPPPAAAGADPSYWHHQRVAGGGGAAGVGLTPGTPCFPVPPQVLPPTRFPTTPVPGIPPPLQSMYKVEPTTGISGQPQRQPQSGSSPNHVFDIQPSKESIDAAIGDVLSKPWLPLPLGLKPPAVDSVLVELQRQGIPNIPPPAASS